MIRTSKHSSLPWRSLVLLVGLGLAFSALGLWWGLHSEWLSLRAAASRVQDRSAWLRAASEESGVDPYLLGAVMICESSGRVGARSSADALGLFQLLQPTAAECARRLGLPEPDEEQLLSDGLLNARLGANYLAWLLQRAPQESDPQLRVERALVSYNTGPGRVDRWISAAGSFAAWRTERQAAGDSQVLAYANKVLRHRDYFREQALFEPASQ